MTLVEVTDDGPVRRLTLNRPGARNALGGELISALFGALVAADEDDEVRAVVLTGADPAFCAGVDLKQAAAEGARYFARFVDEDCIGQAGKLRKPVVAAVNGPAITGGLELALSCDLIIASDRAAFLDTHARVGVLPGGGLTVRLPQLVGQAWARRMSMTGELVDAALAERIGLVTEVVPHELLLDRAHALAGAAAEVPGPTMQALKAVYVARSASPDMLSAERSASAAHPRAYDRLDDRRAAVTARNRAMLGAHRTGQPPEPR